MQPALFPSAEPPGFALHEDWLAPDEERRLLDWAAGLPSEPFVMRGQASLRRISRFGVSYGLGEGPPMPMPAELELLRARAADQLGLTADAFAQALVSRYPAGAGIGWHRDFPIFGDVIVGISLGAPCRMRLRPRGEPRRATDVWLPPRSAYVLSGPARHDWEHHIPPVRVERWSVTLRTLRQRTER